MTKEKLVTFVDDEFEFFHADLNHGDYAGDGFRDEATKLMLEKSREYFANVESLLSDFQPRVLDQDSDFHFNGTRRLLELGAITDITKDSPLEFLALGECLLHVEEPRLIDRPLDYFNGRLLSNLDYHRSRTDEDGLREKYVLKRGASWGEDGFLGDNVFQLHVSFPYDSVEFESENNFSQNLLRSLFLSAMKKELQKTDSSLYHGCTNHSKLSGNANGKYKPAFILFGENAHQAPVLAQQIFSTAEHVLSIYATDEFQENLRHVENSIFPLGEKLAEESDALRKKINENGQQRRQHLKTLHDLL